jgi:hypothetical protein
VRQEVGVAGSRLGSGGAGCRRPPLSATCPPAEGLPARMPPPCWGLLSDARRPAPLWCCCCCAAAREPGEERWWPGLVGILPPGEAGALRPAGRAAPWLSAACCRALASGLLQTICQGIKAASLRRTVHRPAHLPAIL